MAKNRNFPPVFKENFQCRVLVNLLDGLRADTKLQPGSHHFTDVTSFFLCFLKHLI
jgi:hypothetical protein